jgi:RNA polymerase sigma-70 factor (ECF subfamily)
MSALSTTAPPSPRSLRQLRRAGRGDRSAIERFYAEHVDALYAFVHPRVGGRADVAEDVVQTVLVNALRQVDAYDPERASVQVWLRLLSRNVIRSHRRANAGVARMRRIWSAVHTRLSQQAPLADELLSRAETRELVQLALATLPPHQQAVLRARYLRGQSFEQIAQDTDLSVEAVRSRLARARKAFRRAFVRLEEDIDG